MTDALPKAVRRYLDAYCALDVDGMLAVLTDDVRFENVSNVHGMDVVRGKEDLEKLARASAQAFSARKQTVRQAVVSKEAAALEIDFEGVVAADLPNGWKAGQTIALRGASFFELRGGRLARIVDIA